MRLKIVDIKDLIVPRELAILAKEKGFTNDNSEDFAYNLESEVNPSIPTYVYIKSDFKRNRQYLVIAPTIEILHEWIKLNFKVYITPFHESNTNKWGYTVIDFFLIKDIENEIVEEINIHGGLDYTTEKEAMIAALTETLNHTEEGKWVYPKNKYEEK